MRKAKPTKPAGGYQPERGPREPKPAEGAGTALTAPVPTVQDIPLPGAGAASATPTPSAMALAPLAQTVMVDIYGEVGRSGLKQHGGFLSEEFLQELRGPRGMKVYREMRDNSAIIGACLTAFEMPMRQVEWRVEPADESAEAEEYATFVEECLQDMSTSWEDTLSEICSMMAFGWSWHECVYKLRQGPNDDPVTNSRFSDGRIGWRKIALRSQDSLFRWEFDANGGIRGMWQLAPPDYVLRYIPIEKSLLFRVRAEKNNPEGRSLLRNAYFCWYFAKRLMEIEAIWAERDLTGLPVAGVPPEMMHPSAPQEQKDALERIRKVVRDIKTDENMGIVFPMSWDERGNPKFELKLLGSPGMRAVNTTEIITRYDQRIAQTVMADFMMLGHDAVGSRALAQPKMDFFVLAVNTLLDGIADVLNRYAIPRLLKLNAMNPELAPVMKPGMVQQPDLAQLATYLKTLSDAGMPLFPNTELQEYLMQIAHLPKPSEEALEQAQAKHEASLAASQMQADDPGGLQRLEAELAARTAGKPPGGKPPKGKGKPPPKGKG